MVIIIDPVTDLVEWAEIFLPSVRGREFEATNPYDDMTRRICEGRRG